MSGQDWTARAKASPARATGRRKRSAAARTEGRMADSGGVSRGDSKFMYSARRQPPASQRAFTASTPRR
ncbi:MAG TPA: hypothetical protein IAB43_02705 [Candidatus Spyradocola merdavium]|nr:hypothetical protein [Candidatus Spyradocola merdavium]